VKEYLVKANARPYPFRNSRRQYQLLQTNIGVGCYLALTRYSFTSQLYCGSLSSFYAPPLPATPTLWQYYCTPISQYTPPLRPTFCMPCTIQYWRWQYRVKPKLLLPPTMLDCAQLGACSVGACPTQESLSLLGFCAQINRPLNKSTILLLPLPPASPTRLQYYYNTIAQ